MWRENQSSIDAIDEDLRTAAFTVFERSVEPMECSISLSRWQAMVGGRFWSTFSNFTNGELEAACATNAREARAKTAGHEKDDADPILRFEDRLILLVAS